MIPRGLRQGARRQLDRLTDRWDWQTLTSASPGWNAVAATVGTETEHLRADHDDYVATVSIPEAALSLETSALLSALCLHLRPARVLDLGSGFSSVVLGARTPTLSVDDKPDWGRLTEAYAARIGTPITVQGLDALEGESPFDLVLHDLGHMVTRRAWLGRALELTGRIAVLDDAHKPGYTQAVRDAVDGLEGQLFSVAHLTRDRFGRFALVWIPGDPADLLCTPGAARRAP